MYACNAFSLGQLLSLRDGEPLDADGLRHVEHCAQCSQELARLRTVQASLKALPSMAPPAYDGAALRTRLRAIRAYRAASIASAAGVGALTLLLITAVYGTRSRVETTAETGPATAVAATVDPEPNVNSLVIRSQELESRLQQLPRRPHIERASTSATIDTLQDRIQWVDYQLSVASDVGITDRQSAQLWENRIQLMDSLVKVRYAEAQRSAVLLTGIASY